MASGKQSNESIEEFDVLIIGAGVSGLYAIHHFREMGLSVRAYDGAKDVGGPGGTTAIRALASTVPEAPTTATRSPTS